MTISLLLWAAITKLISYNTSSIGNGHVTFLIGLVKYMGACLYASRYHLCRLTQYQSTFPIIHSHRPSAGSCYRGFGLAPSAYPTTSGSSTPCEVAVYMEHACRRSADTASLASQLTVPVFAELGFVSCGTSTAATPCSRHVIPPGLSPSIVSDCQLAIGDPG